MSWEHVLFFCAAHRRSFVIVKFVALLLNDNLGCIVEEDSSWVITQLVTQTIFGRVINEFSHVHWMVNQLWSNKLNLRCRVLLRWNCLNLLLIWQRERLKSTNLLSLLIWDLRLDFELFMWLNTGISLSPAYTWHTRENIRSSKVCTLSLCSGYRVRVSRRRSSYSYGVLPRHNR